MKCCKYLTVSVLTQIAHGCLIKTFLSEQLLQQTELADLRKEKYSCVVSPISAFISTALNGGVITGLTFLQDTVNSFRYLKVLQKFATIFQVLDESSQFKDDDTRPHRVNEVFTFLDRNFDDLCIALDYHNETAMDMYWPSYSPNINLYSFFLW